MQCLTLDCFFSFYFVVIIVELHQTLAPLFLVWSRFKRPCRCPCATISPQRWRKLQCTCSSPLLGPWLQYPRNIAQCPSIRALRQSARGTRSLGLFFCFLTVAWCQPTPRKRHPSLFPPQRQLPICLRFSFRLFHWLARCQSSASSLQESWVATARKHLAAAALVAPLACSVFPATAGCYGKLLKVNRVVFLAERIRRKQEDAGPGCL